MNYLYRGFSMGCAIDRTNIRSAVRAKGNGIKTDRINLKSIKCQYRSNNWA